MPKRPDGPALSVPLTPEDLPEAIFEGGAVEVSLATNYQDKLREAKRAIVLQAIQEAQGNYTEAAQSLGLHSTNLHRLIRNLGMKETIAKK